MKEKKNYIYLVVLLLVLMVLGSCSGRKEKSSEIETEATGYDSIADKNLLVLAVHNDDLAKIKELVSDGFDVNTIDSDGLLPLIEACIDGQFETAKYLVENGADINKKDDRWWHAIIEASGSDSLELVQYLLDKGADIDATQYNNGFTPLLYSIYAGNTEIAKLLLERGADIDPVEWAYMTANGQEAHRINVPIVKAAASGNLELVKLFLDKGVAINIESTAGITALMDAARYGHLDIVKYLMSNGADPTMKTYHVNDYYLASDTPLMILAVSSGNLDLVKYLESEGIKSDIKLWDKTALHYAAQSGNVELVKYLVNEGLDPDARTDDNESVSHYAALSGNVNVMKYLASKGADMRIVSDNKDTLLHYAAYSGSLELVKYLVEEVHLDINAESWNSKTVIMFAKDFPEIQAYLIGQGATAPIAAKIYPTISKDDKIWMRLAIEIADQHDVSISKIQSIKAEEVGDQGTGQGVRWDGSAGIDFDGVLLNVPFSVFVR